MAKATIPQAPAPVGPGPSLRLTPLRPAVPVEGGTIEVLVRVQAPERAPEAAGATHKRIPLRLALVVDRSGSMAGEPLTGALRCVQLIGASLQPDDQLAVVLYDDKVQVPVPLVKSTGAQAVAHALAGVESGGSTDLYDGWESGARQLMIGIPGRSRGSYCCPTGRPIAGMWTQATSQINASTGLSAA